jgi:hypothetical protein
VPDLLDASDPDYAAYNSGDVEFLLRSVGETIRDYCGWHLAPSVTVTLTNLEVGSGGILMLPSRYVTSVNSVSLQPNIDSELVLQDPASYVWRQGGWIEPVGHASWRFYEPGFHSTNGGLATVVMTHGYPDLPANVKRVAYELAGWATALGPEGAGGDIKIIRSPGFELGLGGTVSLGANLNPDQKARLANYTIGRVK